MKVQITQKYVYHKVATIEVEIDKDEYTKYITDNRGYILDDYLLDNEELWVNQIHKATNKAELLFANKGEDDELRYDCEELKTGGHL